jgi:hypothetical protein
VPPKGGEQGLRFWKERVDRAQDDAVSALAGLWEGQWNSGLVSHLRVEFIETGAASITYAWEAFPRMGWKAGWTRHNAKVLEGGGIEFVTGQYTHRYTLSTFMGKRLNGDCQPCQWNGGPMTVLWSPSTTFPKIE